MMSWQPIETAPVPKREELRYGHFRCLLQDKRGEVFEGHAGYVNVKRPGYDPNWQMRWYSAAKRWVEPIYWMPLPERKP
jgi:hypothetical protein